MTIDSALELLNSTKRNADRLESQVHRQLFDKIRFGTYALGQRLPSEHALCEEHGVSRPIVRAALAKLRDSGLIVSRQGAGSFVCSWIPTGHDGYGPLTSVEDMASYFGFRRMIESSTVRLAAQNATPDDVGRLCAIVDEMVALLVRGDSAVGADLEFHLAVAETSGNRFLAETMELLRPHWTLVGNFFNGLGLMRERTGKRLAAEHMAIVDAISKRDPIAAAAAMVTHITASERRAFKED